MKMQCADRKMPEAEHIECKALWHWILLSALILVSRLAIAQTPAADQKTAGAPPPVAAQPLPVELPPVDLKSLPRNIFVDQKNFWTTPFHMSTSQWQWTVPLAFVGAGLLASDTAIEGHVPTNPTTVSHAITFSNGGWAPWSASAEECSCGAILRITIKHVRPVFSVEKPRSTRSSIPRPSNMRQGGTGLLPATDEGSFSKVEFRFRRNMLPSVGRLPV